MVTNIPEKTAKLVYISGTKFIESSLKRTKQNQIKNVDKKRS